MVTSKKLLFAIKYEFYPKKNKLHPKRNVVKYPDELHCCLRETDFAFSQIFHSPRVCISEDKDIHLIFILENSKHKYSPYYTLLIFNFEINFIILEISLHYLIYFNITRGNSLISGGLKHMQCAVNTWYKDSFTQTAAYTRF